MGKAADHSHSKDVDKIKNITLHEMHLWILAFHSLLLFASSEEQYQVLVMKVA